jgi:hypothetical protein
MLAVRSPSGASTVVVFAIALAAGLAQRCAGAVDVDEPIDAPAINLPAIDIDEPAPDCEGVTYEFVPYIYTPPAEPPRTREEAIERARPAGILGMIVARPCGRVGDGSVSERE